jgi:hypothetical protein
MLVRSHPCAARLARSAAARSSSLALAQQGLRFEVHVSTFDETLDKSSFASAAGAEPARLRLRRARRPDALARDRLRQGDGAAQGD